MNINSRYAYYPSFQPIVYEDFIESDGQNDGTLKDVKYDANVGQWVPVSIAEEAKNFFLCELQA